MLEDRTLLSGDFGDAPDTGAGTGAGNYETLSTDNGPVHTVVAGLRMGATVDEESIAQQSQCADGDDDISPVAQNLPSGILYNVQIVGIGGGGGAGTPSAMFHQSFTATKDGMDAVEFRFAQYDSPSGFVEIREGAGLGGNLLGTSNTVPFTSSPSKHSAGPLQIVHFDLPSTIPLTPGNTYTAVYYKVTGSNYWFGGSSGDAYAGGQLTSSPNHPDWDAWFIVRQDLQDDEDGLPEPSFDLALTEGTSPAIRVNVTNTTGSAAALYGWIDYNGNGVFENTTERASVSVPNGTTGTVTLTFPAIPAGTAGTTYTRFRLSTDSAAANPTGAASDGEVEDYVVWINVPYVGQVKTHQKIRPNQGNFTGSFGWMYNFGESVTSLGDLDADGVNDLVVGVPGDNDGGSDRGAVWVLFLNSDGTVKSHQKISDTEGDFSGLLDDGDAFGTSVTRLGDLDGDGVTDLAVGASADDDEGYGHGALWVLFLNADGTVKGHQKISSTAGNFTGMLDISDRFGESLTSLGDLDGDGVTDLAVGAVGDDDGVIGNGLRGAVWVLFLNPDGTVKSHQKISSTAGNFTGTLDNWDEFGSSVSNLGDLDADGVIDLAVGASQDEDGGADRGAVWLLFLNADGTVKSHQKISDTEGNCTITLDDMDYFGASVTSLGDLDGNGVSDVAVGASGDIAGAVWVLFLNADGTVKSQQKISDTQGNFTGTLNNGDFFGNSVTNLGDLNGDGTTDLAVGAYADDDSGENRGAVWILSLWGPRDFGDAPDSYGTRAGGNGASHEAIGPALGTNRDTEFDGQPTANADGDDTAGSSDDEDGLVSQSTLTAGNSGTVTLNVQGTTGTHFINAWIDFNADGDWADTGEQIASDFAVTTDGNHTITFTVPATVVAGKTVARFRLDSSGGLSFTGQASDGEVEDHQITITSQSSTLYVDDDWAGTDNFEDPDGGGPASTFGNDAFASLQQAVDAAAVGVTLNVAPGNYNGVVVERNLIIDGGGGEAIIQGSSPALTVTNGEVIVKNGVTFSQTANDPTILVENGGSLTLQNSTVNEASGFNNTAIQVDSGGVLDLSSDDNTINVIGAGGELIDWADANPLDIAGNTLTLGGAPFADNFAIEDAITHAMDNAANGLVTWVANNVFVTTNTLGIQRGIDVSDGVNDTVFGSNDTFTENVNLNKAVTLSGELTIVGQLQVTNAGATLNAGFSPGTMTVSDLDLVSGSTFTAELQGTTPGTGHDQYVVNGAGNTITLGNATLNVQLLTGFTPSGGDQFMIIDNQTGNAIPDTFNGLPEGSQLLAGGAPLTITYVGGDGDDVVLSFNDKPVIDAGSGNNNIQLRLDTGGNLEVEIDSIVVFDSPLSYVSAMTINGENGDDALTVDFTNGDPIPSGGLTFNGGAGATDTMTLTNGSAETLSYIFSNQNDGFVAFDTGTALRGLIDCLLDGSDPTSCLSVSLTYAGLEPITDNLSATNRIFVFSDTDDQILLEDLTATTSRISSNNSETTTFTNPTASLTVFAGGGDDAVNGSMSSYGSFLLGGSGTDTVTGGPAADTLNGGPGVDTLDGKSGRDRVFEQADSDFRLFDDRVVFKALELDHTTFEITSGATSFFSNIEEAHLSGGVGDNLMRAGTFSLGPVTLEGLGGNDTLVATNRGDSLDGGAGHDLIRARAGADTLTGGTGPGGSNTLFGGVGRDLLFETDQNPAFTLPDGSSRVVPMTITRGFGTADELFIPGDAGFGDTGVEGTHTFFEGIETAWLIGGSNDNDIEVETWDEIGMTTLEGRDGDDTIRGAGNADCILGGNGDDELYGDSVGGSGNDTINGEAGDDLIRGGGGRDLLFGGSPTAGNNDDTIYGGGGDDTIYATHHDGTTSADVLTGRITVAASPLDDQVIGLGNPDPFPIGLPVLGSVVDGNNRLSGDSGADLIFGGREPDTIYGGSQDDLIFTGVKLTGAAGADDQTGGDWANAGSGADTLYGSEGSSPSPIGKDTLRGGSGNDLITGGDETSPGDLIIGGNGDDTINAEGGDDTVRGNAGADSILGGTGDDCLRGDAGDDTIQGGDGDDAISGNKGADSLLGEADNDDLTGGPGDDILDGGTQQDTLHGGRGADTLTGGDTSADNIDGGPETDVLFENTDANFTLTDTGLTNDDVPVTDTLARIEQAVWDHTAGTTNTYWKGSGFSGSQTLIGGDTNESIVGGTGKDLIIGGEGLDTIEGGDDDDLLFGGYVALLVDDDLDVVIDVLTPDPDTDLALSEINIPTDIGEYIRVDSLGAHLVYTRDSASRDLVITEQEKADDLHILFLDAVSHAVEAALQFVGGYNGLTGVMATTVQPNDGA